MRMIALPRPGGNRRRVAITALAAAGIAVAAGIAFFLTLPDVSLLAERNPGDTALMEQRAREAARTGKKLLLRREWMPLPALPLLLRQAVRVSEDAAFYEHEGVDFHEIRESIKRNWREGKLARGGSTITQQLAKNLFLSTARSPWRKLREYFIARRLEEKLSKDRILELYLNCIELGPGVFGVEAASRFWFGKSAQALDPGEIVRLVAIIPRPLQVAPDSGSRWIEWRARWILGRLNAYGYISSRTYAEEISRLESGFR